jgi:hypothetical protein
MTQFFLITFTLIISGSSCRSNRFQITRLNTNQTDYVNLTVYNNKKFSQNQHNKASKEALIAISYTGIAQTSECPTYVQLLTTDVNPNKNNVYLSSYP